MNTHTAHGLRERLIAARNNLISVTTRLDAVRLPRPARRFLKRSLIWEKINLAKKDLGHVINFLRQYIVEQEERTWVVTNERGPFVMLGGPFNGMVQDIPARSSCHAISHLHMHAPRWDAGPDDRMEAEIGIEHYNHHKVYFNDRATIVYLHSSAKPDDIVAYLIEAVSKGGIPALPDRRFDSGRPIEGLIKKGEAEAAIKTRNFMLQHALTSFLGLKLD